MMSEAAAPIRHKQMRINEKKLDEWEKVHANLRKMMMTTMTTTTTKQKQTVCEKWNENKNFGIRVITVDDLNNVHPYKAEIHSTILIKLKSEANGEKLKRNREQSNERDPGQREKKAQSISSSSTKIRTKRNAKGIANGMLQICAQKREAMSWRIHIGKQNKWKNKLKFSQWNLLQNFFFIFLIFTYFLCIFILLLLLVIFSFIFFRTLKFIFSSSLPNAVVQEVPQHQRFEWHFMFCALFSVNSAPY